MAEFSCGLTLANPIKRDSHSTVCCIYLCPLLAILCFFFQSISLIVPAWPWVCDPYRAQSPSAIFHLFVSPHSWHKAPACLLRTSPFPHNAVLSSSFQCHSCDSCQVLFQEALQAVSFADFHFGVRSFFLISVMPYGRRHSLWGSSWRSVWETASFFVCMTEVPGFWEIAFT